MPHLNLEEIARLVDVAPDPHEGEHLDACIDCRRELDEMRADAATLAALPLLDPPAGEWPAIRARLAREGLVRPQMPHTGSWRAGLLRAAAAIAIFVAGILSGSTWSGSAASDEVVSAVSAVSPARQDEALIFAREPRNAEEAARLAHEIEALYFNTLVRMTEARPMDESGGDPFARLAALEGIVTLTGAALGQAPADPVLNGYHLVTLAQREATLQQIATRTRDSWF